MLVLILNDWCLLLGFFFITIKRTMAIRKHMITAITAATAPIATPVELEVVGETNIRRFGNVY